MSAPPPKTFADLEPWGLELVVTCQRCGHVAVVDDTSPRLKSKPIAGRRFRCKSCEGGIGLPSLETRRLARRLSERLDRMERSRAHESPDGETESISPEQATLPPRPRSEEAGRPCPAGGSMNKIELTVLVNKVNTGKVKEAAAAHGGRLEERTTAHALAEKEEPADKLAEKVVDHDILCFAFEAAEAASAFVEAASTAIGVTPDIFKSTMTSKRDGKKFDLPVAKKDQAQVSKA